IVSLEGTSPFPSLAGAAHTPVLPPVGSGHVGFCGSAFVALKYPGSSGASSALAGSDPAAAPTSSIRATTAVTNFFVRRFMAAPPSVSSSTVHRSVDPTADSNQETIPRTLERGLQPKSEAGV